MSIAATRVMHSRLRKAYFPFSQLSPDIMLSLPAGNFAPVNTPPMTASQVEHSVETTASAQAIWRLFSDVPGWKRWNPGIQAIQISGPFAVGTTFQMTLPSGDVITSVLREVRPNEAFVDETEVGDLLVRVSHRIESLAQGHRRIVYDLKAIGPGAAEMGPAIASDFPDVLRALVSLAESLP